MDEEVLKNVMELFTKVCKNDVNPIKSYKQYLDELTNEDITNIIIFFSTMIKNEKDLEKINNILNESKENKELEILKNIKKIINLEMQVFSKSILQDIVNILKNNGYIECIIELLPFVLNTLVVLKYFGTIFVNIKDDIIKIHMPIEIMKIVNEEINLKGIDMVNKEREDVITFIEGILNAYGMISIKDAYVMFKKLYRYIMFENFERYIFFTANIMHMNFKADEEFLYNINLLDEEIPELGEMHLDLDYCEYQLNEIILLADNKYYIKYMQYKALKEFVESKLDIPIEVIKEEVLDYYIILAQMDVEDAESYMEDKLSDLDIKERCKRQLKEYIREVYDICPKWKLKGKIKYKKSDKIRILKVGLMSFQRKPGVDSC